MFCPNCGKNAMEGARFCESCGTALPAGQAPPQSVQAPPPQYQAQPQYGAPPPAYGPQPYGQQPLYALPLKNAGVAAILALIIPGAGHIYDGKLTEGIMYLVLSVVLWVIGILTFFGLIFVLIFYVWQVYDAFKKANEYNSVVQQTGRAPW